MSDLDLAYGERYRRGENLVERRIERMLDSVGLDQQSCLAVGPGARDKLKGILARLAKKKHPFTTCMRDLAKNRPELSKASRERICGRLKSMVEGTGRAKALSDDLSDESCPLVDADVFALLESVDDAALDLFISGGNKEASSR